jgi:hypothetical protein
MITNDGTSLATSEPTSRGAFQNVSTERRSLDPVGVADVM